MISEFAFYLATGATAGMLSGLFGVGGGLIIVPVLSFLFASHGFPAAHIMHMALATSLATIAFTSISSAHAHHLRGSVNIPIALRITPGIMLGSLLGALLASQIDTTWLKGVFVVFIFYVGTQMLLEFTPSPSGRNPGTILIQCAGTLIGAFSSLVGIGGGTLSVPFLIYCSYPVREAVGTSSAIGLPIAVFSTAGYIMAGQGIHGLPQFSFGFVYLPALGSIVLASVVTAPFGAWLAHRLPVATLKRLFALLLYGIGAKMALSL